MNRAGIQDGQVVATIVDKFGEDRDVVQRGSRIRIANSGTTPILAMNRTAGVKVGERIRAARLAAGLTLEECAIRAGMTSGWPKNRMYEIETTVRNQGIRLGTLYAIAAALDVDVRSLIPSLEEVLAETDVERRGARLVTLTSAGQVVPDAVLNADKATGSAS